MLTYLRGYGLELIEVWCKEPREGEDVTNGALKMTPSSLCHRVPLTDGNMPAPSLQLAFIASLDQPTSIVNVCSLPK
jgi:hypothetical protein